MSEIFGRGRGRLQRELTFFALSRGRVLNGPWMGEWPTAPYSVVARVLTQCLSIGNMRRLCLAVFAPSAAETQGVGDEKPSRDNIYKWPQTVFKRHFWPLIFLGRRCGKAYGHIESVAGSGKLRSHLDNLAPRQFAGFTTGPSHHGGEAYWVKLSTFNRNSCGFESRHPHHLEPSGIAAALLLGSPGRYPGATTTGT